MFKLSKQEIMQSLVSTAITGAAVLITRKVYEKKLKNLEFLHKEADYQNFSSAFRSGWDEGRRSTNCYCAPHKEYCVLHLDNLYPDRQKD